MARARGLGGARRARARSPAPGTPLQWSRPGAYAPCLALRRKGVSPMLSGEKILLTGPAGRIAFGLARSLAGDNEVWGIARFGDPASREKVEQLGVTTRTLDIADGDYGDLPTDFTYLLHLAADFSPTDYDRALASTRRPPGSSSNTAAGRRPPWSCRRSRRTNPTPTRGTRSERTTRWVTRGCRRRRRTRSRRSREEGVARYCARSLDLPVTIAAHVRGVQRSRWARGLASGCGGGGSAGADPLGPDALQPDPR